MNVDGKPFRTIWPVAGNGAFEIIDQTRLPHAFAVARIETLDQAAASIREMRVRGAPLIGATAAYGLCVALDEDASDAALDAACAALLATRPTAVNLRWAVARMRDAVVPCPPAARAETAWRSAARLCDEDVATNRAIAGHGRALLDGILRERGGSGPLNVLTHCNAGWLATVDWGTALAPVYLAHDAGVPIHVWVDETRPRNQGASLTAWELDGHGVPHTVIVDNAGGHLMQHGMVDCCIVGSDRTTAAGDVCNKVGTYLKALAAFDNGVPFYVAVPGSTIDWTITDGVRAIEIEERGTEEVTTITGRTADGRIETVAITPAGSRAANYAFDVTPARLVTALITERGVSTANAQGLAGLYPDRRMVQRLGRRARSADDPGAVGPSV